MRIYQRAKAKAPITARPIKPIFLSTTLAPPVKGEMDGEGVATTVPFEAFVVVGTLEVAATVATLEAVATEVTPEAVALIATLEVVATVLELGQTVVVATTLETVTTTVLDWVGMAITEVYAVCKSVVAD